MDIPTSETLIERIHDLEDQEAWDRLFQIYAPLIRIFAMERRCPNSSLDDVVQQTFVSLIKALAKSPYDKKKGKFRTLLYLLSRRQIYNVFNRQKNKGFVQSNTEYDNVINNLADSESVEPCKSWDDHWENNLMARAYEQVKKNIRDHGDSMTLEIFESVFFEQLRAKDVAKMMSARYGTGVKENKIYQDKSRVLAMWKHELKKLKEEFGD